MLVRLLYASRSTDTIDPAFMDTIVDRAEAANREHGITGILCTYPDGGLFLQVLEGGREAVNHLYTNICRDKRHRDVTLLDYTEITERRFAGWQMGSVDLKRINVSTILRFSEKPVLDPFSMSGRAAVALLEELVTTAAITSHGRG